MLTTKASDQLTWQFQVITSNHHVPSEFQIQTIIESLIAKIGNLIESKRFTQMKLLFNGVGSSKTVVKYNFLVTTCYEVIDALKCIPEVVAVTPLQYQFESFKIILSFKDSEDMTKWIDLMKLHLQEHLLAEELKSVKLMPATKVCDPYVRVSCTPRVAEIISRMSGVEEIF